MFIQRDLRKVPEIIADESKEVTELKLGRRAAEFHGSTRLLCAAENIPRLAKLERLNLYHCGLNRLTGIGNLEACPLRELALGRNELKSLPNDLARLAQLETLWLDDNHLTEIPDCLLRLRRLTLLRLSGNRITTVPDSISTLGMLQELALDANLLRSLPRSVGALKQLKRLILRGNELTELPESIGELVELELLNVSSNRLEALPKSVGRLVGLKQLIANSNRLSAVPADLVHLKQLSLVNLEKNLVQRLPKGVASRWRHVVPWVHTNPELVDASAVSDTPSPTPRSSGAGAGAGAGTSQQRATSALEALAVPSVVASADGEPTPEQLKVMLLGNPIAASDPSSSVALTEAQYTQPLTATWQKKG